MKNLLYATNWCLFILEYLVRAFYFIFGSIPILIIGRNLTSGIFPNLSFSNVLVKTRGRTLQSGDGS